MLLREIIKLQGKSGAARQTVVTASTGIAALNIGGTTLHSWAGIGLGMEPAAVFIQMVLDEQLEQILTRWRRVKTLVIDESKSFRRTIHSPEIQRFAYSFHDRRATF